jgi:LacI family transcriptional regulator
VSKATVSRVLNKARFVDPETRRRVLESARKLNYYRNAHAQRLARGRSDFFGLIISDIENPVFPEVIKSFETAAAEKGYDLLLCTTNYDPDRTQAVVRKMIENRVRGVAVMTSGASEEVAEELAARQVAVVFLDLGLTKKYISNIRIDYSLGIRQAADHLLHLGHQNFAYVAGGEARRSARKYRQAVVEVLTDKGLPSQLTVECDQTLEGGIAAAGMILAQPDLPTAVLCINDLTAIGVMTGLRQAGLRVPEEMSVIGCEDIYLARFVHPPLTSVRLDRKRLGQMAYEALEIMFRSRQRQGTEFLLETQLVVRESTAPCNTGVVQVAIHNSSH